MTEFGNLLTAMVTPFNKYNELDVTTCGKLAEYLVYEQSSDGLVLSGTTGESPTLTVDEKLTLYQAVIDRVGEYTTVIAGTGNYDTEASVELTREAEDIGVHGIMLVTPYYNRPGANDLYCHFKTIAEKSKLPIMLYNVPKRTGVNLDEYTILKLAEIDNIVAIKEASGELVKIANIVQKAGDKIKVYSGDDVSLMPVLSLGGIGVVSVASHLIGYQLKQVIESFHKNDVQRSLELYFTIHSVITSLGIDTNPIPIKSAVNDQVISVGSVRPPLKDLSAVKLEQIIDVYNEIKGK